jgi:hypothetical protein
LAALSLEQRTGGLLDDLLMTSLDGTFSLSKVYDVTLAVSKDLHLDMSRSADVFLEENCGVLEQGLEVSTDLRRVYD